MMEELKGEGAYHRCQESWREAVFGSRVQATSDPLVLGRGEACRVWFRVDRGESQCIAPVGATSWLRAFVVTRGRTPVADSAESCTT